MRLTERLIQKNIRSYAKEEGSKSLIPIIENKCDCHELKLEYGKQNPAALKI